MKLNSLLVIAFSILSFSALIDPVAAKDSSVRKPSKLHFAKPESVGMSSVRLKRIDQLADNYIKEGNYSGIVTMVARRGKVVHANAAGTYGVNNPKPMEMDTLFRIYSMTKPITAIAAMMLYEEGRFHIDDPVSQHLPEFTDQKLLVIGADGEETLVAPQSPMTIRQLFTHTAGLTYGFTLDNPVDLLYQDTKLLAADTVSTFTKNLASLPLRFEPGTRYHYSVSIDLIGALIERLSGMTLADFFQSRIFDPLGMTDTFFSIPDEKLARLASDQYWDAKTSKVTAMPEASKRSFSDVTFYSGGGGLVSTISDYMRFCQMILNGGSFNGHSLLGPKTIEFFASNHLTPEVRAEGRGEYPSSDLYAGQSMALGLGVVTEPELMPAMSTKGEISWGGLAGTKFWISPKDELIGIALVQLYRAPTPLKFDMKVAAYQAITDLD